MSAVAASGVFLWEAAGPRMTVAVLGTLVADTVARLAAAVGPTGLVVRLAPDAGSAAGGVSIRAHPLQTPLLSHAADLVLVPHLNAAWDVDALIEEVRRLLAPHGRVRVVVHGADMERLVSALAAAHFRRISGGPLGIAAHGPR